MSNRSCIYIPSIDAKDLYLSNNSRSQDRNKIGYRLTTNQGEINYNRFINSLDFSLDSEELRSIAKSIYGNNKTFTFIHAGKEYSNKIINVTFKYSCRDFNKLKKNTYVMEGYLLDDLIFHDSIATDNGNIVGIITDTPIKGDAYTELPHGFRCEETETGEYIYKQKNIKGSKNKRELRE